MKSATGKSLWTFIRKMPLLQLLLLLDDDNALGVVGNP